MTISVLPPGSIGLSFNVHVIVGAGSPLTSISYFIILPERTIIGFKFVRSIRGFTKHKKNGKELHLVQGLNLGLLYR